MRGLRMRNIHLIFDVSRGGIANPAGASS